MADAACHGFSVRAGVQAHVQAGDFVIGPAVQPLHVLQTGVDQQVVVHLDEVPVDFRNLEFPDADLFAHEVGDQVIAHAQAGDFGEPVWN